MTLWNELYQRAYELCFKANRYEVIGELVYMDIATLSGLIARLSRLIES